MTTRIEGSPGSPSTGPIIGQGSEHAAIPRTQDPGPGTLQSWFNSADRIAALEAEALSWVRTPFVENCAVKGRKGGVSCHFLAATIYRDVGFLPGFVPPRGFVHKLTKSAPEAILDFVDADPTVAGKFAKIEDLADPLPGDLVALQHEGVMRHLGIVLPQRRFVHVLRVIGVRISHLDDPTYSKHIAALRRPLAGSDLLATRYPLPATRE